MRLSLLPLALAVPATHGYSGMGRILAEIHKREVLDTRATSLLGDLVSGASTAAGGLIANILSGAGSALADATTYKPPGAKDSDACKADKCCIWSYVVADMVSAFTDGPGCSAAARGAIRLGFHDAGAWNTSIGAGGADGSIILSPDELGRQENRGLESIAGQIAQWHDAYKGLGVGAADLVQMAALAATVVCPGGPRIRAFVGRKDSAAAPPEGLLPSPLQEAPELVELFGAKTFSPADLVALVGAHTVSQQFSFNPDRAGAPQDSSDGKWDTTFYQETQSDDTPDGVVKFPSDVSLSKHATTTGAWKVFAGPGGLATWQAVSVNML
jgi:manganese peroxidase